MSSHGVLSFLCLSAASLVAGGCSSTGQVQALGSADLQCPSREVHVVRGSGSYTAHGCGKWIEYDCITSRGQETCLPHPRPDVHADATRE
jgi:hypothetical protein